MSTHITLPDELIVPEGASLAGVDGNAFYVMGYVRRQLRRAGNPPAVLESYTEQATAGDHDHLLRVSVAFLDGK